MHFSFPEAFPCCCYLWRQHNVVLLSLNNFECVLQKKAKFFSLSNFPKSRHAFPNTVGFLTLSLKLPHFHYVAGYKWNDLLSISLFQAAAEIFSFPAL